MIYTHGGRAARRQAERLRGHRQLPYNGITSSAGRNWRTGWPRVIAAVQVGAPSRPVQRTLLWWPPGLRRRGWAATEWSPFCRVRRVTVALYKGAVGGGGRGPEGPVPGQCSGTASVAGDQLASRIRDPYPPPGEFTSELTDLIPPTVEWSRCSATQRYALRGTFAVRGLSGCNDPLVSRGIGWVAVFHAHAC